MRDIWGHLDCPDVVAGASRPDAILLSMKCFSASRCRKTCDMLRCGMTRLSWDLTQYERMGVMSN
jgi:hypothetical protein